VPYTVKKDFDYHKPEGWLARKVNIDGVVNEGRFLVKRNRGKQEGYCVLAPFTVSSVNSEYFVDPESYNLHNSNRKFIINLGWIPRSRKHYVFDTIPDDVLGEETYANRSEAVAKQSQDGLIRDPLTPSISVPVTNVTAYVRLAEAEDRANGRINWKTNFLYKWIDLNLLTRVFRIFNEEEGETIYLERTFKRYLCDDTVPKTPRPSPFPLLNKP
jgi:hypothetical protein